MSQQRYYDKHKRNKESRAFYRSKEWQQVRELALKRDNYLCVQCLKDKRITKANVVHHVIELKDDITRALELSNLESICHAHHNGIHKSSQGIPIKKTKVDIIISKNNPEII